ncbi:TPA: SDR family NAD(P)-dependent oxidoreductase [Raoultella planticola]
MTTHSPTALITGASSGIGAVYAGRLAARGYNLILVARREQRLQDLADQLQSQYGIQAHVLQADLSEESGIRAVEQRLQSDPTIALFINNAGTAKMGGFLASDVSEHQTIHTLNTTALLRLSYAALAAFSPRRQGTLINIASILALHTLPGSAVYSASKAWVLSFTRGLQEEFADSGLRIQVVLPAATATDLWPTSGVPLDALPAGSVMTTEDLVDAALSGLDQGENVTLPPVHELALWENFDQARLALFSTARTGQPAPRYRSS